MSFIFVRHLNNRNFKTLSKRWKKQEDLAIVTKDIVDVVTA